MPHPKDHHISLKNKWKAILIMLIEVVYIECIRHFVVSVLYEAEVLAVLLD
jgi:hypothetical protein